uniref:FLYWCH-type domain-containing protein n=1 Tax=Meloidogyne hapla TaxID=6305 RepID=A0A1I8B9N6_MELHA
MPKFSQTINQRPRLDDNEFSYYFIETKKNKKHTWECIYKTIKEVKCKWRAETESYTDEETFVDLKTGHTCQNYAKNKKKLEKQKINIVQEEAADFGKVFICETVTKKWKRKTSSNASQVAYVQRKTSSNCQRNENAAIVGTIDKNKEEMQLLNENILKIREENRKLNMEKGQLNSDLSEKEEKIKNIETKYSGIKKEFIKLKENYDNLCKEMEMEKKQVEENHQAAIADLNVIVNKLKKENYNLIREKDQIKFNFDENKQKIEEQKEEIKRLEEKLKNKEETAKRLQETIDEYIDNGPFPEWFINK